jgi:transposase InsO family protein
VPRRRPRKWIATGRPRPQAPTGANQVWSYDFVFDWCANGQQLKCLTVTDEWTQEGLAIEVDDFPAQLLQRRQGAALVEAHQSRVAHDIGRDDGGEAALLGHSGRPARRMAVNNRSWFGVRR